MTHPMNTIYFSIYSFSQLQVHYLTGSVALVYSGNSNSIKQKMSDKPKKYMTEEDKKRIMSTEGKKTGGHHSDRVARQQSAADKNENSGVLKDNKSKES